MRVLGIDPAAAGPTGYGVVETDGRNCWMLRFGALPALAKNRRDDFPARLRHGIVRDHRRSRTAAFSTLNSSPLSKSSLLHFCYTEPYFPL